MSTGGCCLATRRSPRYFAPQITNIQQLTWSQNVVLSEKPAITSTIPSLPPALLDQLITELSTLASVYHTPPESFLGQGRFGAEAMQRAAIEEQQQNARENPIAAAAAAAAASGASAPPTSNVENLLDIDFDGSAPASMQNQPGADASGLEGLAGTPQRVASPTAGGAPSNNMDDLMGLFGGSSAPAAPAQQQPSSAGPANGMGMAMGGSSSAAGDLMNGFAGLDMGGGSPAPQQQQGQPQQQKPSGSNDLVDLI